MENIADTPIRIDLDAVLRQRAPGVRKYMPRFVVRSLERLIHQDGLNYLLEHNHGRRDADFCAGVLSDLDVSVDICGPLPDPTHRKVILVSNHPLGALDGISLIDVLSRHYSGNIYFIVNDLLMAVEPLSGVFVPINKHGRQSRDAKMAVDMAMESDCPVVIFPAGLCSRKGKDGKVCDLEWKKMFVAKARQYGRDIVPLHFNGRNSEFFYNFARWRKRLGIKFNLEMVLLPREIFRSRGKRLGVCFGTPISHKSLSADIKAESERIKKTVYSLLDTQTSVKQI